MNSKNNDLPVVIETEDFMVINKPEGMSVHNETPGQPSVHSLLGPNFHLVHRLDKETSGVLLVAKSSQAASALTKALSEKTAAKKYSAVLRGQLKGEGPVWSWPLSDKGEGRKSPQGKSADRKPCQTRVEILKTEKYFTLILASLDTGRQHQIRKHAALAGHSIVGDSRYNEPKYNENIFSRYQVKRMMLHAQSLSFQFKGTTYLAEATLPAEYGLLLAETKI